MIFFDDLHISFKYPHTINLPKFIMKGFQILLPKKKNQIYYYVIIYSSNRIFLLTYNVKCDLKNP
jgi:hypothetical protein